MLDNMSMAPGPSRAEVTTILFQEVCASMFMERARNSTLADATIPANEVVNLQKVIEKFVREKESMGSEAAWAFGMKDVLLKELKVILHRRWENILVSLRAIGAFTARSVKRYAFVEWRYRPGGVFETEAAARWNPLLLPAPPAEPLQSPPPEPPSEPPPESLQPPRWWRWRFSCKVTPIY